MANAKIKKVKLGETTYDLCDQDAVHLVDGLSGESVTRYGVCSTSASTAAKTVNLTSGTLKLDTGTRVTVKFSSKNTASTPTLNVNSSGAKKIYHNGSQITTGTNKSLLAGAVDFVYDGTQWHLVGNYVNKSHSINSGTDAEGESIVGSGSSGTITLGDSGVTEGWYGPDESDDSNPAKTGTVVVPEISVNSKGIVTGLVDRELDLPEVTIPNKSSTDTEDLVYTVSNLVESGVNGHTITPTYTGLPTKAYVDRIAAEHAKYLGTVTAITSFSTTAGAGDFYRVSTPFAFGSDTAHINDIIMATKNNPGQNTTDWTLLHADWRPNTKLVDGYVPAPTESNPYKVWHTDSAGNPAWRVLGEANLAWGGKNFAGSWSPIDASMVPDFAANRLAFLPASAVKLETSTNGTTWTTLSNTTLAKNLFSVGGSLPIGNNTSTGIDKKNYKCRITITTAGQVYSVLNKFAIKVTTNGSSGCHCKIEAKTKANCDSGTDTWATFCQRAELSGWPGWNIINTTGLTTYGNTSAQYNQVRFTFGVDTHPSNSQYAGLQILKIMAFGGEGWNVPSNMARNGDMYTYDADQNVTFPGNVSVGSGKTFVGNLQGAADKLANTAKIGDTNKPVYFTANGVPTACSYELNKSVPSNAVFTDTNTKVNTTLATTTKAFLLGTSTTPTSTAQAVTAVADTGVYLDTTAGQLVATTFKGSLNGNADTATTATKLSNTTAIGSATKPVYFTAGGVPTAGTYELNKSVPSDAIFTDSKVTNTKNNTAKAYITGTTSSTTNTGTQIFDTNVYLDTTAGQLVATTFKGNLDGNAATATSAVTAGSATTATTANTANAVAWSGVTGKPTYYDAKAIKSITRSGTTFTYTCLDDSTGTFTQQDSTAPTKAQVEAVLTGVITSHSHGTAASTDETVTLASDLYTYANVGKITGASNSNPVKVADKGATLKTVFNKVFGTQSDEQPTITGPSLSVSQTGTTSVSGGEYGSSKSSITATVTFTANQSGSCSRGYRVGTTKTTGSQTIKYPITKQSGVSSDIKITLPSGQTASSSMVTAGTYVSSSSNVLYCNFNSSNQVTIQFTVPTGYTTTSTQTRYGKVKGEVSFGNAQTTSGTSITKFLTLQGNDATAGLSGGSKSQESTAYTINAGYVPYTYSLVSSLPSTLPSSNRSQSKPSSITVSGGTSSTYLYIFVPSSASISTIYSNGFGVPFSTAATSKEYAVNNGKTTTFKVYKTNSTVASGTFDIT